MDKFEELLEEIVPNHGKLLRDEHGTFYADIIDQELDPIRVYFHYDNGVELDVENYKHINLDKETLLWLATAIEHTEKIYSKEPIE